MARGALFQYEGSIKDGINIVYGDLRSQKIVAQDKIQLLLNNFSNKTVPIEETRTIADLNEGSLGHWLNTHENGPVITSYVAAILVHEGYAEYCDKKLRFKNYQFN
ncbi:hypothetical protein [Neobacillus sp. FSL H8-0543]|uniref:hypothetical protein n=1 Tax=Neobacillus sp. FSL H8-0543 TaxID=2954672 RepID=UPI003158BC82